jgi:hypothetical protein
MERVEDEKAERRRLQLRLAQRRFRGEWHPSSSDCTVRLKWRLSCRSHLIPHFQNGSRKREPRTRRTASKEKKHTPITHHPTVTSCSPRLTCLRPPSRQAHRLARRFHLDLGSALSGPAVPSCWSASSAWILTLRETARRPNREEPSGSGRCTSRLRKATPVLCPCCCGRMALTVMSRMATGWLVFLQFTH